MQSTNRAPLPWIRDILNYHLIYMHPWWTPCNFTLPCFDHLTSPCPVPITRFYPALPCFNHLKFRPAGTFKSTLFGRPLLLVNTFINTFITLSFLPCFTWFFAETMSVTSRETPVPALALAHADIWYAFYNAINRYGLDKSYVPTIPMSVVSQGRIPPVISRYINNAFVAGARDARVIVLNVTVFPVPDYNAEETVTCVLECYY